MFSNMTEDQITLVFKALAHTERRRILASLLQKPGQTLFDLCVAPDQPDGVRHLTRQTVSQHLDALERAGLLEISWQGRTKTHGLEPGPLRAAVQQALAPYL